MKIYGVTLVRNEADIIGVTIRYHLGLGFDGIFVADNGSSDGTGKIIDLIAKADERVQGSRHEGEYHQSELLTGLAQEAFRAGADWIVPFDADEFWVAPWRTFREVLASFDAAALRGQVIHYIQSREQVIRSPEALLTMTKRAARTIGPPDQARALVEAQKIGYVEAMYAPKLISRASKDLVIGMGYHSATGLAGKSETTIELVCLHAPLRSRDTLLSKAELSRRLEAAGQPPDDTWHAHRIRRLLEDGLIESEWAANSYLEDALDVYGTRRHLIIDTTLRDAVAPFIARRPEAALPDEKATEPQIDRNAWHRDIVENFLTNLQEDALYRTQWAARLDEELSGARTLILDLQRQVADRTAWAQTLDKETLAMREHFADLAAEITKRTAWAKTADAETKKARDALAELQRREQGQLHALESQMAERTAWAQKLNEELAAARAVVADLQLRVEERTAWARAADAEVKRGRTALAELRVQFDERTSWAQAANQETEKIRVSFAELRTQLEERTSWARSANSETERARVALAELRTQFEERTAWAHEANNEAKKAQAALAELQTQFEERTAWALKLQKELGEAHALIEQLKKTAGPSSDDKEASQLVS